MDTAKEEVCYQREEGGVEPIDRRQVGQQCKSHPWGTQEEGAGQRGPSSPCSARALFLVLRMLTAPELSTMWP